MQGSLQGTTSGWQEDLGQCRDEKAEWKNIGKTMVKHSMVGARCIIIMAK